MKKETLNATLLVISNQPDAGNYWERNIAYPLKLTFNYETNPDKAINSLGIDPPDLFLFDIKPIDQKLMNSIQSLRDESVVPILFLIEDSAQLTWLQLYRCGIDQVISKPIEPTLLQMIIRAWLRHTKIIPSSTLDRIIVGPMQLNPNERILIMENGKQVKLTNLEMRFLYCLMSQPQHTISSELIIDRMWGNQYDADQIALKNVVYRLRRKIEIDPAKPALIKTMSGVGYSFGLP